MVLKYLLRKEFTQIRRNSFLPRLIIVFPIMVMCVMPWVMNMEVKNIVVDVVDNDRSIQSQRLVHEIEANNYFVFHGQQPTYAAALSNIEHSTSDAIVVIPQHYSRDLVLGRTPQVLVAANAVNGTKGSIGSAYLSQVVIAHASPSAASVQSQVSTLYLYNKQLDFKRFMIPALFAIVMMLMTGFLPTLNIVGEKEAGTIEQINVTPVSKWTFILAKLIPYWIIAFFVVTVCLLLSWGIYGIVPVGSIALVYLLAMLLALFFPSFFVVMLMLLSGLFTPTRSMPYAAYLTTYVNPVSYFIEAMRTVCIRGGDMGSISHQVLALLGIGLFMSVWAVQSYKKNC